MNYSPIALFVYNRLSHTKKSVEALLNNYGSDNCELFIFSDGAKDAADIDKVAELRKYLRTIKGFRTIQIFESENNKRLANSIINGITSVFEKNSTIIVLEDDLVTSPYFIEFMNNALCSYSPEKIWSIAGYCPPIYIPSQYTYTTFIAHRNCSWGWATWKENWEKTDWTIKDFEQFICNKKLRNKFERGGNDLSVMLMKQKKGIINSWSIRFNYAAFKNNLPTIYPCFSMVSNQGADGSGTHMKRSSKYRSELSQHELSPDTFYKGDSTEKDITKNFKLFYNTSILRFVINQIKISKYNCKKK